MGSVSLLRLFAALLFASLVFRNVPVALVSAIYAIAMCSDLVDGYLARKLNAESQIGKVVDLVSDKALTIVSLLYAAASGISIAPLALIAAREIIMIGSRAIIVEGKHLLPTNRILGGLMSLLLWGNTLFLVLGRGNGPTRIDVASIIYWFLSFGFGLNLIARIHVSMHRIKTSVKDGQ